MNENVRKNVDQLVDQFWKRGYFTVSRKFGTYLPEPSKVGGFDVDIIVAMLDDEVTVKSLELKNGKIRLIPENDNYQPIPVEKNNNFSVIGKVKGVVRWLN